MLIFLLKKLIELLPYSTNYILDLSENHFKEYKMLERLKLFCELNNLSFLRNTTNGDTVDLFINSIPVQCKFCSFNDDKGLTYTINMKKASGLLNCKIVSRPYDENDNFEFVVVELCGFKRIYNGQIYEDMRYLGNFCFIPKKILIERGILKSSKNIGQKTMGLCPPDYSKDHWSKQYWHSLNQINYQQMQKLINSQYFQQLQIKKFKNQLEQYSNQQIQNFLKEIEQYSQLQIQNYLKEIEQYCQQYSQQRIEIFYQQMKQYFQQKMEVFYQEMKQYEIENFIKLNH